VNDLIKLFLDNGYIETEDVKVTENDLYQLTNLGYDIIRSGKMILPDKGPYIIHTINDDLFPESIVGCNENEEKVRDEFYSIDNSNNYKRRSMELGHEWINNYPTGENGTPKTIEAIAMGENIVIYQLESPVIPLDKPGISLTIILILDPQNSAELRAYVNNKSKGILVSTHNFYFTYDEVLSYLLGERRNDLIRLDSGEYALLCSFKDLSIYEKNNMLSNMTFKNPDVPGFGVSENVIVKNIRLLPKTRKDALLWASHFMIESINGYIDEGKYDAIKAECSTKFIDRYPANEIIQHLPDYNKFAEQALSFKDKHSRLYWFVYAPKLLTAGRS
jgi:hypothetical protein